MTQTRAFPLLGEAKLYVPNILSILRQQQFAFKNLLYAGEDKCLINYKRILYLQQMIFEYDYQKKNANFKKIFNTPVNITAFIKNLNRNLLKIMKDVCPGKNSSQLCKTLHNLHATHESELITMQQTHHSKQEQQLHEKHRKNEYEEQQRTYEYDPQQEQQMYELYQILQQQNKSQGGFIRRNTQLRRKHRRTRRQRRNNKTHKR